MVLPVLHFVAVCVFLHATSPLNEAVAFTSSQQDGTITGASTIPKRLPLIANSKNGDDDDGNNSQVNGITRRDVFISTGVSVVAPSSSSSPAWALFENPDDQPFSPAKRPTAYRVDSTIPPTLLPVPTVSAQTKVLQNLGRGLGTDKEAIAVDTINLNNMLNKAVFGTAAAVSDVVSGNTGEAASPASFVCLGVPSQPTPADVSLGLSLFQSIAQQAARARKKTALGISVFPYSTQPALDAFVKGTLSSSQVQSALEAAGVSTATFNLYQPALEFASTQKLDLIALAVEIEDRQTVLSNGLQNVNPTAREQYVVDPEGFIAQVNDPKFKLYTDRSLLKDAGSNKVGNFFSDRILVHEAAATALSRYAASHPNSVIAMFSPTADLRYLNGSNGRIPRVYQKLTGSTATGGGEVTANDVTTILLNPTPNDTLSKTRRLRLEIGTGPETLAYQTKVADYLWFSASPSVSLLPRLMDYKY